MSTDHDVTRILGRVADGDDQALEELIPLLHDDLRSLADQQMRGERPGHTLQPTALVNEAYLRLVGNAGRTWKNRQHFLASAANTMRSILVDHARRKNALKRGRGQRQIPLEELEAPVALNGIELLELDTALEQLAAKRPEHARIAELRIFGGLGASDVADVLGLPQRTVGRYWSYAAAWLGRAMEENREGGP